MSDIPAECVEAIDIVALHFDAKSKEGTPEHAKAVQRLKDAKELWRDKFKPKPCPHCGKRPNNEVSEPARDKPRS